MDEKHTRTDISRAEFADISQDCCEKLRQYEEELKEQGYQNVALVAYQMKD